MWNSHQYHSVKNSTQMITFLPVKKTFLLCYANAMDGQTYLCLYKRILAALLGRLCSCLGGTRRRWVSKKPKKKRETANQFIFFAQVCGRRAS